jgi:hypothetical protein
VQRLARRRVDALATAMIGIGLGLSPHLLPAQAGL